MKAVEIKSKTDEKGYLKLDYDLDLANRNVRVLILLEEDSYKEDEQIWLDSISNNEAFDFLNDPAEDIYSLNDGKPLDD